ncbi:ABC transporter substrate-binding protein [Desulfovibrio inopinatus]|uniref:ABC transporter substrate-binding protein n=1 Tax=Desulfovibrio inopinatus TaxID=102109 RepID=UPI00041E2334|nr:ABC transporter substrate-binding protein [Desulfovibrio inopinatus]
MNDPRWMNRRRFLVTLGQTTGVVVAASAMGPFVGRVVASDATLRICSYGGSFQESQRKAFFDPFSKEFNVKIIEATDPDIAKVKAQVMTKNYEWDVVDMETRHVARGEVEGLLEPLDLSIIDTSHIDKMAVRKCAVANDFWTTGLAYNTKNLGGKEPAQGWADFWDVKRFPGPRAMQNQAPFNLEFALIADGVPMEKLYPLDLDRAFKKMDAIRDHITVWWKNGAEQIQLLSTGEVTYSTAWNGRISVAKAKGAPLGFVWNGGCFDMDWWCVPKGNPNKKLAMQFINFALSAKRQAYQFGELIPYGPTNLEAFNSIPEERARELPNYPANAKVQFLQNADYWGEHLAAVTERWNAWMLG